MVSNIALVIIAFSVATGALAKADQGTAVQSLAELKQSILGPKLKGVEEQTFAVTPGCRLVVAKPTDTSIKQKDAFLLTLESSEFKEEFIFSEVGSSVVYRQPSQMGDGEMVLVDYKIRGLSASGEQIYFTFQLVRTDTRIYMAKVVMVPLSATNSSQVFRCADGI